MRLLRSALLVTAISFSCAGASHAQAGPVATGSEARTARAFEAARKQGPLALRSFLIGMPKGADLHVHLSGAVYAENFIRAAGEDGLCIDPKGLNFVKPGGVGCGANPGTVSASDLLAHIEQPYNQGLYDKLIDAFSMRSYVPTTGWSGHDQFFATFAHFGGTDKRHTGEWVDEVVSRAANQNEQYVELMETPPFSHAATIAYQIGWDSNLAEFRQKLLDAGLDQEVDAAKEHIQSALALRDKLERCTLPEHYAPGCKVQVRFLYQVLRALPPQVVFVQLVCGFELASADPLVVGINMVQPEDGRVAMANYRQQMQMVGALHALYPNVHITLHAGELAPGMVPPDGLRFHIRSAIEEAHAERIGHGVDVMQEDHPYDLLKLMATQRIMAEINLTSNDVILNIKGADHPLPMYRQYHVPVALSTDDEGVSRIDLTHEYVRAATTYPLTYSDFKQMVRTGLEHSFLPGDSLWEQTGPWESYARARAACRTQVGRDQATGACASLLDASEKARQQFELERRFQVFENSY